MWVKGLFASTLKRAAGRKVTLLAGLLLAMVVLVVAGDAPRAETAMERLRRKLSLSTTAASKATGQIPLLVPAAEFASVGGGAGLYAFENVGGFIQPYDEPSKEVCMRAPVYLPSGASVQSISAYVYDADPDANISRIELRRAPYLSTAGTELMAGTATTGDGILEIQKLDAPVTAGAVVDNGRYSYMSLVCMDGTERLSSTLRLYTLVINYGSKTYVPFIVNEP